MPTELSGTLEVISTGVGSGDAFGVRWVRPEEREPERWKRVVVIFKGNLCVGHAYWREDQKNGPMKWSINGDKKETDKTWKPEFWLDGLHTPNASIERLASEKPNESTKP